MVVVFHQITDAFLNRITNSLDLPQTPGLVENTQTWT